MEEARVGAWNESYLRAENHVFYPHEHTVRFINRYIRKRLGVARFRDHIQPRRGEPLTALDFGCGIGADVMMMHEFGIAARGVDISSVSIEIAKQYARSKGMNIAERFRVIEPNRPLPFDDGQFDFFISCGVLDSMPFAAARQNMQELSRVTTQYAYISLVAGDCTGFCGEQEMCGQHEHNTIQAYFDYDKCLWLIEGTGFQIKFCERVVSEVLGEHGEKTGRYHLILAKV
jgi:SAM-dependent methyltransferase